MKKLFCIAVLGIYAVVAFSQNKKFNDTVYLQPLEVQAIRAEEKAPFTKINISKREIEKNNLGQDLPFLLNQTPSVVVSSDAGNGVGYTGIRIRGTDATRINVTINGIPYNDAESQGTFFVDIPDIASSTSSIQIQRGVGTSSNGAGAFGATINVSTNELNKDFYVRLNNSYGSFNTLKNNLQLGSGMIGKHFTIDTRLSSIKSDGYIDRAISNLKSFYISTAYTAEKNSIRLNVFSGKEKTYQAWNGVPENLLHINRTYNSSGTEKPGTPYENETDNYWQTHYQLFYNQKLSDYVRANLAFFYVKGKGYYEQYKAEQKLAKYHLPDYTDGGVVYKETDLIRRLWLNNDFYGNIFSLHYKKNRTQLTFGGGYNIYEGKHYGEVIWAKIQEAVPVSYQWYNVPALKKDFSLYGKWTQQLTDHWQSFVDIQFRNVNYTVHGFRDNPTLNIKAKYAFFNPKIGFTYTNNNWQVYASYASAAKEPNRDDFEAGNTQQPKPERLHDFELGVERKDANYAFSANIYYMKYHNQLILTGKINDVGAYTRTNVPNSYRAGIELQGKVIFTPWLSAEGNIALSENKIINYTQYIDDNNGGQQMKHYPETHISFSPPVVAGGGINVTPFKNGEVNFISKYIGRQYMDNTSQKYKSLNPYFLQDVRFSYLIKSKIVKETHIILQLNNVFNKKYEPRGYTFSYITDGILTTENFYYPMAGFNFMIGLNLRF